MKKVIALLLLLIGLLQYRLWFGDGNVLEFHRLTDRIEELRQEGARRRERNAALEAEVMDLKQGLDAVEERARQDLGMIKEGEVFVQVIDPRREPDARPTPLHGKPQPPRQENVKDARNAPPLPGKTRGLDDPPSGESTAASRTSKPRAAIAERQPVRRRIPQSVPNQPKLPPAPPQEPAPAESPDEADQ